MRRRWLTEPASLCYRPCHKRDAAFLIRAREKSRA
nr:MAG TPA: hypothetical protein [Bacteriophage sp.]